MGIPTESRNGGLDWLRASAVCLVMLYHGNLALGGLGWVTGCGWIGVDLFLVLSGLLVTRSWMKNPRWLPYLGKRAARVVPAYLATLLVALAFALVLASQGGHSQLRQLLEQMPRYLTFTTNLPAVPQRGLLLAPLWSLSLEVQLWLLLPALAPALTDRHKGWWVFGLGMLAILVVRGLQVTLLPDLIGPWALPKGGDFYGRAVYATRAEAFLVGMWIAVRTDSAPSRRWLWAAMGLGVLVVAAGAPFKTFGPRPLPLALFQFTGLALGLGALVTWVRASDLSAPRIVRWLSERIYSLYLAQALAIILLAPVLGLTLRVGPAGQAIVLAIFSLVSVLIGAGMFRFIEEPFLRLASAKPSCPAGQAPAQVS